MRAEVFWIGRSPEVGEHGAVRVVEIEGEPWWLLGDLVIVRDYPRRLATEAEMLSRIPEADIESIWVLSKRMRFPEPAWVVSADGASVAHDVLAALPSYVRQRRLRSGRTAPAWKAAGVAPVSELDDDA